MQQRWRQHCASQNECWRGEGSTHPEHRAHCPGAHAEAVRALSPAATPVENNNMKERHVARCRVKWGGSRENHLSTQPVWQRPIDPQESPGRGLAVGGLNVTGVRVYAPQHSAQHAADCRKFRRQARGWTWIVLRTAAPKGCKNSALTPYLVAVRERVSRQGCAAPSRIEASKLQVVGLKFGVQGPESNLSRVRVALDVADDEGLQLLEERVRLLRKQHDQLQSLRRDQQKMIFRKGRHKLRVGAGSKGSEP
eukprot:2642673-Rhodomonas_salina.2